MIASWWLEILQRIFDWNPQSELNVAGKTITTAEAELGEVGVYGTMD